MIDSYMILNRKTSFIIKIFLIFIVLLIIFVIWGVNTFNYTTFIQLHSRILYFDSYYYVEVLTPVKEVKQITEQYEIVIDSKKYNYKIYKINPNVEYINNINYQKVILKVLNLDETYYINGYEMDVKILKEKKKIIDYLKDKKEE